MLTFGSLFAGIGGLDLGLERAGMECRWQVENDEFCRRVLEKHWPHVQRFGDVREVGAAELTPVDLIAGGFPCQDISVAGKRAGIEGERSGLWSEFARIIGELRPRYVLVENVKGLLNRGMGRVLGDLAEIGYDAEWEVISACAFGATHPRERVLLLAYPDKLSQSGRDTIFEDALQDRQEWEASQGKSRWEVMERWIRETFQNGDWSATPAAIRGVPDGISSRVDRLRGLGNAVVPQVAEWVGRCIVKSN